LRLSEAGDWQLLYGSPADKACLGRSYSQLRLREARYRMLGLQFKDFENEIRQHSSNMLPKDLFEIGEDVESITIANCDATLNAYAHVAVDQA
jgi:hypothetical protein